MQTDSGVDRQNADQGEWSFERAAAVWRPMTKAIAHVGVPGYQWQAAVLWDGGIVFGPLGFRGNDPSFGASELPAEFAALGDNLLHLSCGYGDCCTLFDYRGNGNPAVERRLEDGRLPIPHIRTIDGDLAWDEMVFAHISGRRCEDALAPLPTDLLIVRAVFTVTNTGPKAAHGHLWMQFGDASQTQFGYKVSVPPEPEPAIAHEFAPPMGILGGMVRYAIAPPVKGSLHWHELHTAANCAVPLQRLVEWQVPLQPGESAELEIILPYGSISVDAGRALLAQDCQSILQHVRQFWREIIARGGQIETPDAFVNDYAAAVPSQMAQQVAFRPRSRVWMYKTSPNNYENYWPCNAAKALPAFDLRGLQCYSRPVLESFLHAQSEDCGALTRQRTGDLGAGGAEVSGDGFERRPGFLGHFPGWTANTLLLSHGLGMWALASHYRILRDDAWLRSGPKTPLAGMLEACDWIAAQRRRTMREENGRKVPHWGLLPPASAHDWLSGSTIFNDAFCIYGMAEVVRLLRELGHTRTDEVAAELADYRACLRQRYIEARDKARPLPLPGGKVIPFVPRDTAELNWATIDWTYSLLGPLRAGAWGALDPHDELVDQTLAFLAEGLPAEEIEVRNVYSHRFGNAAAADANWNDLMGEGSSRRVFLWKHYQEYETMWPQAPDLFLQRDEIGPYFEWFFNALSLVLHREWRVGVESLDGAPSCAPGEGERWRALRNMFVNERDGYDGSQQSLWLCQAMPRCWLAPRKTLGVSNMRTYFGGQVDLSMKMSDDGHSVTVDAHLALAVRPKEIRMRLRSADGRALLSAAINGKPTPILPGDTIALPQALTGQYAIVGRFA